MPPRTEEELLISGDDGAFAIADDMRSSVKNDDYSTVVGKQVFKHVISSPPTLELSIESDEEATGEICSILVENCTYDTTGSADRSGAIPCHYNFTLHHQDGKRKPYLPGNHLKLLMFLPCKSSRQKLFRIMPRLASLKRMLMSTLRRRLGTQDRVSP